MDDYSGKDLMAAILDLRDATASGFARADAKTDQLRDDMNRRFDRVDERFDDVYARFDSMDERFDQMDVRFDRLEGRVAALEPHGQRPAS